MGTIVSFDVRLEGVAHDAASAAIRAACAVLDEDDRTFSTWKPNSSIMRLQRGELTLRDAPAVVTEVVDRCLDARAASNGWFDPWAFEGGFDPTGLVKGWSAMRALEVLRAHGVEHALVNAAGDIATMGRPAPDRTWTVGVRDPGDASRIYFALEDPGCVATSGLYERGAHVLDPHTRLPPTEAISATVVGPDLGLVDALATALLCAGTHGLQLLDLLDEHEGCIVLADGTLRATPGFPFLRAATETTAAVEL
jgi:thiamine biosynthesis lipoprotein